MSIRERIAATVAPAIDCQAPYAKVMIAKLVEIAEDHAKRHVLEIERLKAWVADLQSGMYVNCVYCGHRYGPGETTPVSMADALKAHVAVCPEHPMAAILAALKETLEFHNEDTECLVESAGCYGPDVDQRDEPCPDRRCHAHGCMVARVNRWRAAIAKATGTK